MTNFQRWALALVAQVYQHEIRFPDGKISGTRKKVYNAKTNKLLAVFSIKEISFVSVDLEEETHKARFTNYPYQRGDYKFRTTDDYTGEGDYYWIRINNYSLSDTYLQGHHERGYSFTIRSESYAKVRIFDQQTNREHIYEISN